MKMDFSSVLQYRYVCLRILYKQIKTSWIRKIPAILINFDSCATHVYCLKMGKRKIKDRKDDNEYDPISKHLVTTHIKNQEKRLIIILESAQLESVKVSFSWVLGLCFDLFFVCAFIGGEFFRVVKLRWPRRYFTEEWSRAGIVPTWYYAPVFVDVVG